MEFIIADANRMELGFLPENAQLDLNLLETQTIKKAVTMRN